MDVKAIIDVIFQKIGKENWSPPRQNQNGSKADKPVIDIRDKLEGIPQIAWDIDEHNNRVAVFQYKENYKLGLNEENYSVFNELIDQLFIDLKYSAQLSRDFLESKTINWIFKKYEDQNHTLPLLDFLETESRQAIKKFTFAFPIHNIEIEKPFLIGFTEFNWYSEEDITNWKRELELINPDFDSDNFEKIINRQMPIRGQVVAKITVNAESKQAKKIAIKNVTNSINALKLYSITQIYPKKASLFGIYSMINYNLTSQYLIEKVNGETNISIVYENKLGSLNFNVEKVKRAYQFGLGLLSDFLKINSGKEYYLLVIQAINFYGKAMSNEDLHERILNLMTLIESLFVPDEVEHKIAETSRKNFSWYLCDTIQEREKNNLLIKELYNVRHKLIHKAKRIEFKNSDLVKFQMVIASCIVKLAYEINKFNTKSDLINYINNLKR